MISPENSKEVSREVYLSTLSDGDRGRIDDFVRFITSERNALGQVRIGILAVGSSTVPEEVRGRPIRDLDLLVLDSDSYGSDVRYGAGRQVAVLIRKYLLNRKLPYLEDEAFNYFKTYSHDGLPLHILTHGKPLDEEIAEARRGIKTFLYFVL